MARPTSLTGSWKLLADVAGGVEALVRELGVSNMTLWRWSQGTRTPPKIVQKAVNAYALTKHIAPPWPETEPEAPAEVAAAPEPKRPEATTKRAKPNRRTG